MGFHRYFYKESENVISIDCIETKIKVLFLSQSSNIRRGLHKVINNISCLPLETYLRKEIQFDQNYNTMQQYQNVLLVIPFSHISNPIPLKYTDGFKNNLSFLDMFDLKLHTLLQISRDYSFFFKTIRIDEFKNVFTRHSVLKTKFHTIAITSYCSHLMI